MLEQFQSPFLMLVPIIELFVLFYLSKIVTGKIALFFYSFSIRQKWTYYLLAVLFLPGTYIHELSHYLFAKLLFVRVYGMTLVPKIEKNEIRLGSVEIEKTDFIRRTLIGAAPLLVGISLLFLGTYYLSQSSHTERYWIIVALGFLVFQVGNTMFLSKKDTEGFWKITLMFLLTLVVLYISGFDFESVVSFLYSYIHLFTLLSLYFLVPIVIDTILIVILSIIT